MNTPTNNTRSDREQPWNPMLKSVKFILQVRRSWRSVHDPTCFGQIILEQHERLHWKGDILEKDILENRINPIQEHSERLLWLFSLIWRKVWE